MPVAADMYYHLYEGGQAASPPIVLIHGAGGNCLYWPSELRRLPQQRVYAPDLPGHGKSNGRGQQSIYAYARLIMEWLNATGTARAVFIGHSMGSAICLTLALHYPEQVLALGLIGAGARIRVSPEILAYSANPTTYHKAVEALIGNAFSPAADPKLVDQAGKRMLEIRPSVLHGDLLACDAFDIQESLECITQPALVVCGAEDRLTPVRYSQLLAGTLPGAALEIIPEAGHMVMLEKPEAVAGLFSEFVAQIPF